MDLILELFEIQDITLVSLNRKEKILKIHNFLALKNARCEWARKHALKKIKIKWDNISIKKTSVKLSRFIAKLQSLWSK